MLTGRTFNKGGTVMGCNGPRILTEIYRQTQLLVDGMPEEVVVPCETDFIIEFGGDLVQIQHGKRVLIKKAPARASPRHVATNFSKQLG